MKTIISILIITSTLLSAELIITNGSEVSLTKQEIRKIYLGKQKRWSDGENIRLVTYKDGDLADSFMKNYLGKKHSQFLIYWKQLMFTGRGMMPKTVSSEEDMIQFIKDNPGTIGYISKSAIQGVSIISVTSEK
jgi:ABC-type phosphate transport system substrate-binding protein